MKTLVSKSANSASRVNPSMNFPVDGSYSFIYKGKNKEGKEQPLFFVSPANGKQVHKNGIPVYQDQNSKFFFKVNNLYYIDGLIKVANSKKVAFLISVLDAQTIEPRDFAVEGSFTVSHEERAPLFRFNNYSMAPRNSEFGKDVYPSADCRDSFLPGKTYTVEGVVRIYRGQYFGTFFKTSVKEINPRTGEALKSMSTEAQKFMNSLNVLSIYEMTKRAFHSNLSEVWSVFIKWVNENSQLVQLNEELIRQIMTQNIDTETKIKLYKMLDKVSAVA